MEKYSEARGSKDFEPMQNIIKRSRKLKFEVKTHFECTLEKKNKRERRCKVEG